MGIEGDEAREVLGLARRPIVVDFEDVQGVQGLGDIHKVRNGAKRRNICC